MKEMEFIVSEKGKDYIVYEVLNNDNTILRPLMEEIERDEMVESARYYFEHPYLSNPKIHIKVKQGKPQAALKRSLRRMEKIFENINNQYKKL
ncbi:MAG: DNA-directed RNA polymerase subunit L [Thermoplasmata archaeon]|jgi:DNA-directed RNA polymerase subunit L